MSLQFITVRVLLTPTVHTKTRWMLRESVYRKVQKKSRLSSKWTRLNEIVIGGIVLNSSISRGSRSKVADGQHPALLSRSQSWSRSARFFGDSSADGNYEVTLMTKATVYYSGLVVWQPPAVYKSSCSIDVEFFPYDVQTCVLKLGSWTYDGFKVPRNSQRARSPDWTFLLVI